VADETKTETQTQDAAPADKVHAMGPIQFLDAADAIFFPRELEYIKARVYDIVYPELKARQYFPIDNEGGWASHITYRQKDYYGAAKIIANHGDDLPVVGGNTAEYTNKVRDLGLAAEWSLRDINRSRELGRRLDADRLADVRRLMEFSLDAIAASGDTDSGLKGAINHSSVTPSNVGSGVGGLTWALKTADEIVLDFSECVSTMRSATNGLYSPNTFLIPDSSFAQIAMKRMSSTSDISVLEYVLKRLQSLGVQAVLPWYRLESAGAGSTKRMVAYVRDPDVMHLSIPQEFQVLPAQQKNLAVQVPTMLATAGMILRVPAAVIYRDGF
jgi:hypothetical protein